VDTLKKPKGAVMSDALDDLMESVRQDAEARARTLQRLLYGADATRVFGPPVTGGEYIVIPAAEIAGGGGLGSGVGFGRPGDGEKAEAEQPGGWGRSEPAEEVPRRHRLKGAGGGGGGGGGSMGRPVAAIVIGPEGVTVKPVVDITRLALTGLGALAAVAALSARLLRRK
jgi:hypothetical protein